MNNYYQKSKPHFEILNGLRGLASLIIIVFHLFETYSKGIHYQIINHGYLAVDFFFMLSGFVIGYAYDDREISFSSFIKRRLIRLHPLLIFGNFFGLLLYYFGDDETKFFLMDKTSLTHMLIVFISNCFLIPTPIKYDIRGMKEPYPFNPTFWSLILEYLINFLYIIIFKKITIFFLLILVILSGGLLLTLTLNIDPFKVFIPGENPFEYTVIGGWGITPDQVYIASCRLLFPFFCGLLISRRKIFINLKYGFFWSICLLSLVLSLPRMGKTWTNGVYESVVIIVVFPIIIKIGAGSKISGNWLKKVCKFLGDISYPIYVTHYPFIYMQMSWASRHQDLEISKHIFMAVCCYVLAILVSYCALKCFDEPLREYLIKIMFNNSKNDNNKNDLLIEENSKKNREKNDK